MCYFYESLQRKRYYTVSQVFRKIFNIHLDPKLHENAVITANADNLSLNDWVSRTISANV